jgi:type IV secretory pathway VirB10-like protein
MKATILGIAIAALGVTGIAYLSARPKPAPAPAASASTPVASSPEPERSPAPGGSLEPERSPEPERSVRAAAPASKPVNTTTVAVTQPAQESASAAAKPAVTPEPRTEPARPSEPSGSSERPVSVEPSVSNEPAPTPAPQKPRFEEVTVTADSVLGVSLESTISSETAKVEDRVNARLSRDVLVDGKVAVPAGARLEGVVTEVTRGGKFKERPRVGVTFQQLILADGTKIALSTDTVFRDGDAPQNVNAKVGGSGVVGAILGAMIGGKKGAVLGGAAGAAGGAAVVAAGNRAEVVLVSGSSLTVRLKAPITVLVERQHEEPIR